MSFILDLYSTFKILPNYQKSIMYLAACIFQTYLEQKVFVFMLWVLPSPLLGDGLNTGPMALWIENSEMAAVAVVVFI